MRAEYPNNSVKFYKVDVRSKADLEQAYNDVMKHFGNIDLVLNGAGVANENYVEDCININIVRCRDFVNVLFFYSLDLILHLNFFTVESAV